MPRSASVTATAASSASSPPPSVPSTGAGYQTSSTVPSSATVASPTPEAVRTPPGRAASAWSEWSADRLEPGWVGVEVMGNILLART
ncbi:hypothetical protein ACFFX0_07870 [Citricoccus parietis]|uniref:Uncharacterized protein n=1 Tax=Citricoccus parietis TaxID=592307 RepID=A0ABV5FY07_9MICC